MNRVVITGIGVISAIADHYSLWGKALRTREHKITSYPEFSNEEKYPAAMVMRKFEETYRTMGLANVAFCDALDRCGELDLASEKIGISFSSSTIGMPELEQHFADAEKNGNFKYAEALSVGSLANHLLKKGIKGAVTSFSTACSSSANALGYAFLQVQQGIYDAVVAGGADALCRLTYYGFQSLKVMSPNDCRPFDANRTGMSLGEGAGFVVLESFEHAIKRGARIYGEILGVGMSADAHHMSAPEPSGKGASLAMTRALKHSRLQTNQIDCISAHGTGTIHNDAMESRAIHATFGSRAQDIYVYSLKSYLGHTLGAAGIIGVISSIVTMNDGFIPPTLGLQNLDCDCNIKMVPSAGIEKDICYSMANAFAFGGNNTSIIIGKCDV